MKLPELLAPAANIECAQAACDHGADAVYVGLGTLNLRANAENVDADGLQAIIEIVKSRGKKVYAALNIMPDDKRLAEIDALLCGLSKRKTLPDAFIVSDPGVLSLCRRHCRGVSIHLSTQTGTFNSTSADFWMRRGVSRIILPRELTLEQITALCKATKTETEMFIHGAMCVSVSGRCLLGAYLQGRHPNFGDCPQSCRLKYRISPITPEGALSDDWYTVEENAGESSYPTTAYLLNSRDLNTISILDRIAATGVTALKIEGRHRSVHYVSSVVKIYRAALDSIARDASPYAVDPAWEREFDRLDHRQYTTGFYGGEYVLQDLYDNRVTPRGRIVGVVRAIMAGKGAVVDVKNPFTAGETLYVLPVKKNMMPYDTVCTGLSDLNGNAIDRALPHRLVIAASEPSLTPGDLLRTVKN
jgi:U32 family peptidase